VLKTTVFLADMKDFAPVNRVYAGFFREHLSSQGRLPGGRPSPGAGGGDRGPWPFPEGNDMLGLVWSTVAASDGFTKLNLC
jgi:hypothetical protein